VTGLGGRLVTPREQAIARRLVRFDADFADAVVAADVQRMHEIAREREGVAMQWYRRRDRRRFLTVAQSDSPEAACA
jgi:hypothetical protein